MGTATALGLALLVAAAALAPAGEPREAAFAAFGRGDLPAAERLCEAWLARHPEDAEVTQLLGMTRFREALGRQAEGAARPETLPALRRAREDLLRAEGLAAGRSLPGLDQSVGYVMLVEGRLEEAVDRLGRAIEEAPDRPLAYRLRGRARLELGDFAAAADDFERAIALAPADAETRLLHAEALGRQGRPGDALAALASYEHGLGTRGEERRWQVLYEMAQYSAELGRLEEARAALERARGLAPGRPAVRLELGLLHYREGRLAEAKAELDAVLASPALPESLGAEALHHRGLVAQHQGRYADGVRDFEAALRLQPGRAATLQAYAAGLVRLGREAEAREVAGRLREVVDVEDRARRLEDHLVLEPRDRRSRVELIELLLRLGRTHEARGQLDRLRRSHPDDPALERLEARVPGGR